MHGNFGANSLITEKDLDEFIDHQNKIAAKELVLVGRGFLWTSSSDETKPWFKSPNKYIIQHPIRDLAQRLTALTHVRSLYLCRVGIENNGVAALGALTQLTFLNLEDNYIGKEGAALLAASLTNLTSLELGGNGVGDQGAAYLASLPNLEFLGLGGNGISDIGASSLGTLPKLKSLSLWGNRIGRKGILSLSELPKLSDLSLWGNQMDTDSVKSLAALTRLISLDIGYNSIDDDRVALIAEFKQLTSLVLRNNIISDAGVAFLTGLSQLQFLNLRRNKVSDLGIASLASLASLKSLNVEENQIDDPRPLSSLPDLEALCIVNGNPLTALPPETVARGDIHVLDILHNIRRLGGVNLYEAKVLILGEGGAGKTSLLRRLYQKELGLPQADESTKGIEIYHHSFTNSSGEPFRLNVWDFGGQQIYHATHQFFLTKRSLYILVDDTRNNGKTIHDEGFKYWLEAIEAFGNNSPVFIFQNEKANRSKLIDEAGIKGRFPNVIDVYRGNLDLPNAAEALEEAIRLKAQELPHVGDLIPAQWVDIRLDLEAIKPTRPYISLTDYLEVYARHLAKDRISALRLSEHFHDLGIFLHFQEDSLLARTVILRNDWATEAVFKILDDEPIKERRGYFNREDCRRVWSESTYADMHPELLALMEKFELCYKIADQEKDFWLLPQLLPPSRPEIFNKWAQPDDLVRTYQYHFLPKGMVSRLMVRMHRFVRDPDRSWGSGAYFEHGDAKLLASISSQSGRAIELRARGPGRNVLLEIIASDLEQLNHSFAGLRGKVSALVPCLCSRCRSVIDPFKFTVPMLLRAKARNVASVQCGQSFEYVDVFLLLDGLNMRIASQVVESEANDKASYQAAANATIKTSKQIDIRKIRIFLASSLKLKEDRDEFELYFRQENDRLCDKGIYLRFVHCGNFLDAMSETRLQDEYNKSIRMCDIFVSLFEAGAGKYTKEEFYEAHNAFKNSGRPLIFAFFKAAMISVSRAKPSDLQSLWAFKKELNALGHFQTEYENISDLKLKFRRQLDIVFANNEI